MAVTGSGLVCVKAYSWDMQPRTSIPNSNPNSNSSPSFDTNVFKKKLKALSKTSKTRKLPPTKKDSINVSNLLKFSNPTIPNQVEEEEDSYLGSDRWLPTPPKVINPRSIYNAASLAYIGDCIYELYARRHFLYPPLSIEEHNDRVMAVVRCEAQDALLKRLLQEDFLSVEERDLLRWGKNINSGKTRTTKRAGVAAYNRASSLETLSLSFPVAKVWLPKAAVRANFLVWTVSLDKILTMKNLKKRGFFLPSRCSLCKAAEEDVDHLFAQCPFILRVWNQLVGHHSYSLGSLSEGTHSSMAMECILNRKCDISSSQGAILWDHLLHAVWWVVWYERNRRVFHDAECEPEQIVSEVIALLWSWFRFHPLFTHLSKDRMIAGWERLFV